MFLWWFIPLLLSPQYNLSGLNPRVIVDIVHRLGDFK